MYCLILERLERHVLNERQIAGYMAVHSTKSVTLPTFEAEQERLDRLLDQQPRREYPPEQAALIAALGLGG